MTWHHSFLRNLPLLFIAIDSGIADEHLVLAYPHKSFYPDFAHNGPHVDIGCVIAIRTLNSKSKVIIVVSTSINRG